MSFTISYKFLAMDAFTKTAKSIKAAVNAIDKATARLNKNQTKLKQNLGQTANKFGQMQKAGMKAAKGIRREFDQTSDKIHHTARTATQKFEGLASKFSGAGKMMMKGVTLPVGAGGILGLHQAGKLQMLEISLGTVFESDKKGMQMLDWAKRRAKETPFGIEDIAKNQKLLKAYSMPDKAINPSMNKLMAIAAGLGKPLSQISYQFAQTYGMQRLQGTEAREMAMAGIPIYKELAKGFGVPITQVKDLISQGKVPFEIVDKIYTELAEKWKGGLLKMSKSIPGQFQRIKDIVLTHGFGETTQVIWKQTGAADQVEKYINILYDFIKETQWFLEANPKVTKAITYLVGTIALLGPGLLVASYAFKALAFVFGPLGKIIMFVATAFRVLAVAMLSNPVVLIITAIVAVIAGAAYLIYTYWDNIKKWASGVSDFMKGIDKALVEMFKWVGDKFEAFVDNLMEKWTKVKNFFAQPFKFLGKIFGGGSNDINVNVNKQLSTGPIPTPAQLMPFSQGAALPGAGALLPPEATTNFNVVAQPTKTEVDVKVSTDPGTNAEVVKSTSTDLPIGIVNLNQ